MLNQKGEEVCGIHVSGLNCIVVCIDGLLALVVGRDGKSLFIDPLLLLASTKSTDFHGWYVSVGASSAGFVFWLLWSCLGGRSKRSRDFHVIGVLSR